MLIWLSFDIQFQQAQHKIAHCLKNLAKFKIPSEIDYVSELIGEQFKITNPQTKSSCGCGVSFSI